jgi:hemolysin activation/secretion protein
MLMLAGAVIAGPAHVSAEAPAGDRAGVAASGAPAPEAAAPQDQAAAPAGSGKGEAAPEAQEHFDIWGYQVEGNTLVDRKLVERAVYPYIGPGKTIEDVEAARDNLERVFRDSGYATVLVDIPEQNVDEGIITLAVAPGKVGRLRVTGSRYFSLGRIKQQVPALAEGEVPYLPDVQKQLTALNKATPDRVVTPVLRPGRAPGQLEVELKVKDELPLHGSVEVNNHRSRDTSDLRASASVRYANLWQKEHTASFSYQVAPQDPKDVEVFSGTYSFSIPDSSTLMTLYGVKTDSDVATVGTLGVIGKGTIAGLRATRTLPPLGALFHSVTLGLDYKDFDESVNLQGADALNTPISYSLFGAAWSGSHFGDHGTTEIGLGVNFAVRGFGNTEKEFENKRFRAKPNFIYLTGNVARTQELFRGAELFASLEGQVGGTPLVSNEQFSMGGANSVRAYLESQQLVDDGVQVTVELRSPSFANAFPAHVESLRIHGFIDVATGRLVEPLPGQESEFSLLSAGLGLRAEAFDGLNASFDWACPFEDSVDIEEGDSRVHFTVGYEF